MFAAWCLGEGLIGHRHEIALIEIREARLDRFSASLQHHHGFHFWWHAVFQNELLLGLHVFVVGRRLGLEAVLGAAALREPRRVPHGLAHRVPARSPFALARVNCVLHHG